MVKFIFCLFFFVALALSGYARGSREPRQTGDWLIETEAFPSVNPLRVEGDIIMAGSSTVFPLVERMAARFNEEGYNGTISIDSIGTGAGFERFCRTAESDISNASRPINESERAQCEDNGRNPIEFLIGLDALAIIAHPSNDWLMTASIEELATIFTAERWNDIDASWPDEPIRRFIPGTDSGTFDYFVEEIFDHAVEPLLSAPNTQFSEDDNTLVRGVAAERYAIGFLGYVYFAENSDMVANISIGGAKADADNVLNQTYPLVRPLALYSDGETMTRRPQVAAFIAYILGYVHEEIVDVGYFPIDADIIQTSQEIWLDVTTDLRNE